MYEKWMKQLLEICFWTVILKACMRFLVVTILIFFKTALLLSEDGVMLLLASLHVNSSCIYIT